MKKANLLLCCSIATVLIIFACKKQLRSEPERSATDETKSEFVKSSQLYFNNTVLKIESDGSTTSMQIQSKTAKSANSKIAAPLNRLARIKDQIKWNSGFSIMLNGKNFVFVPIDESLKPFKNKSYEFVRYLVFENNSSETSGLSIIEILGDKGASLGDAKQTSINSYTNVYLNQSNAVAGLNASVIVYDLKYVRVKSFHVTNGAWEQKRIEFRSDLEIAQ